MSIIKRTNSIAVLILIISFVFISGSVLKAAIVPLKNATIAAGNFINELYVNGNLESESSIYLHKTVSSEGEPLLYIFNITGTGFVIISAEDEVYPVLGWSFNGEYSDRGIPPALEEWLKSYTDQIVYIRDHGLSGDEETHQMWRHYSVLPEDFIPSSGSKAGDVAPLLTCKWNQSNIYNALCPVDIDGPGGRALAGCVATAMGQVLYYYRYPDTGSGISSYNHSQYGSLSVDHGNTYYDWNGMGNMAISKSHLAIAELLYHLGVSVEMNYGPNASGAYSQNAANALKDHFNYDQTLMLVTKNNYSSNAWASLLRSNLDEGHPLYYHGFGSGGHAFNVDGYQGTNHFHFNWGWSGSYDGYFFLNNLNPGGQSFTNGQGAIINFKPPASSYPYYCTATPAITALAGSIEDGSGPIEPYQNQTTCTWLIQPAGTVSHIDIIFQRFSVVDGYDTLFIYDGIDQNAPLLASITGDTVYPTITTTGGAAFLRFVASSTSSVTSDGWFLTYEGFRPVFCTNLQEFTAPNGTFDDGSGPLNEYNDNTNCKYYIVSGSPIPVKLTFNYFSIEDGKDYLRIYDPTTVPSTLLANYTGSTIPADVIAPKGQMLLIFNSDNTNSDMGWEVEYTLMTDIPEHLIPAFELFPNPASDKLFIRFNGSMTSGTIVLSDLTGRHVRTITEDEHSSDLKTVDISGLNDGIYLISLRSNKGIQTQKLVIRKN